MAAPVLSSPLSSPPTSVVHVALSSPVRKEDEIPILNDHQKATAETIEVNAKESAIDPDGKTEREEKLATQGSGEASQSSTQKRKASIARKPASAKKARSITSGDRKSAAQDKKWEAPFVFTNSKSPLANASLRASTRSSSFEIMRSANAAFKAILLHPDAWDVLTPEEKKDVLAKFPDETRILNAGSEAARPDLASLANDDNFRYDCARYCENIELGRHDEEWLTQAWVAHEKHKRGDYDEFLREQFEEDWGTEMPVESSVKGTESQDESKEASTVLAEPLLDDAQRATAVKDNPPRLSVTTPLFSN
ncbi:hypothetical protein C7999DRAFT_11854 [Corynascus novoguineensis]|uniref:ASX DEUBAD domain-containing protein n=1 Tax=Corynascus novoguineensis TaxID=1126955 RepID=A0AAN7CXT3_9PEZI|nr:hypothetical protein C7999DRAFT_11854 [Corynascus novoguineensis]